MKENIIGVLMGKLSEINEKTTIKERKMMMMEVLK